jgi:hypothetical protein
MSTPMTPARANVEHTDHAAGLMLHHQQHGAASEQTAHMFYS